MEDFSPPHYDTLVHRRPDLEPPSYEDPDPTLGTSQRELYIINYCLDLLRAEQARNDENQRLQRLRAKIFISKHKLAVDFKAVLIISMVCVIQVWSTSLPVDFSCVIHLSLMCLLLAWHVHQELEDRDVDGLVNLTTEEAKVLAYQGVSHILVIIEWIWTFYYFGLLIWEVCT
jgi:hypothetical protein